MFDEEKVKQTIHKNQATSYGLTLVIGLPLPADICSRVHLIQRQLEVLTLGCFFWYDAEHLHATLVAPLRGRYREHPVLQQAELPADLNGFAADLADFFAKRQPFSLELGGVNITPDGMVTVNVACETDLRRQLAASLRRHPALDLPKHEGGLRVVIGHWNSIRSSASDEAGTRLEQVLLQLTDIPIGRMTVQQVWLVHYANRTLDRIVGRIPLTLGQANSLTAERLLRELGIAVMEPPG